MRDEQRRAEEYRRLGYDVRAFEQHVREVASEREQDSLRSLMKNSAAALSNPA